MRCISLILPFRGTHILRVDAGVVLRDQVWQLPPSLQQHRRLWRGAAFHTMSPRKDSIPHEMRTAAEPRQNKLYTVHLTHVEQINPTVRLLRLSLPSGATADEEDDAVRDTLTILGIKAIHCLQIIISVLHSAKPTSNMFMYVTSTAS